MGVVGVGGALAPPWCARRPSTSEPVQSLGRLRDFVIKQRAALQRDFLASGALRPDIVHPSLCAPDSFKGVSGTRSPMPLRI